jgi:ketosteroid isomerase-like protein
MRLSVSLMALLSTAVSMCLAQDETAIAAKIVALEKAWNQAYKLGDKRGLDTLLDDHIVLINDDGTVQTKAAFLAGLKGTASQEQQVAPESITVHVFGNAAIATGVFRAKGVEAGKRYSRRERFVDTWIYKEGNWVCVATNATPVLH